MQNRHPAGSYELDQFVLRRRSRDVDAHPEAPRRLVEAKLVDSPGVGRGNCIDTLLENPDTRL